MKDKNIITIAGILGITAIILGAFGAHALKKVLSLEQLNSFEIGVKYQMYHALFLLIVGTNNQFLPKVKKTITILTFIGVLFFSGSIYLLTTSAISQIDFKFIGIITPIGGLLLILAWGVLIFHSLNKKS